MHIKVEFEQEDRILSKMNDVYRCLFDRTCYDDRVKFVRPRFGLASSSALDILRSSSYIVPHKLDVNEMIAALNEFNFTELSKVSSWVSTKGGIKIVPTGIVGDIDYTLNRVVPVDMKTVYIKGSFLTTEHTDDTPDNSIQKILDAAVEIGAGKVKITVDIPVRDYLPKVLTTILIREIFSDKYFFSGLVFGNIESPIRTFSEVRIFASAPQQVFGLEGLRFPKIDVWMFF
jgi:hypothetical protein